MPIYEYHCEECGSFAQLRRIDQSSQPAKCPECGTLASKIFPIIHLRSMRSENRTAWERNERSAHAPHVCSSGCSHGTVKLSPSAEAALEKPRLQSSRKRNRRPWMLGH